MNSYRDYCDECGSEVNEYGECPYCTPGYFEEQEKELEEENS